MQRQSAYNHEGESRPMQKLLHLGDKIVVIRGEYMSSFCLLYILQGCPWVFVAVAYYCP
jgi:hypothetical protein